MNSRKTVIIATITAGLVAGVKLLPIVPSMWPAADWSNLIIVFFGCAVGIPTLWGYLATYGKYLAMVRLWSFFGLISILLVAAGFSAALQSTLTLRSAPNSNIILVVGLGLFTGLVLIKLAIRKERSKNEA